MLAPNATKLATTKEDELHWLALCLVPGLGTVKAGKLVAQFHSPQAIFRASRSELESRGPSKYFARAALQAAQDWKFKPATVDGRGVLSTWILRFEFTRSGTAIVPTQEMP